MVSREINYTIIFHRHSFFFRAVYHRRHPRSCFSSLLAISIFCGYLHNCRKRKFFIIHIIQLCFWSALPRKERARESERVQEYEEKNSLKGNTFLQSTMNTNSTSPFPFLLLSSIEKEKPQNLKTTSCLIYSLQK